MTLRFLAPAVAVLVVAVSTAGADARGTVVITPLGGHPKTVTNATIVRKKETLVIRLSSSRTITLAQSSCENNTDVLACVPLDVVDRVNGSSRELNLSHGLLYANLSKVPQAIPHETAPLPRNGIWLSMTVDDGTSITVRGTLDPAP
jgi:hypothetical protein